jgi:tripartite ATP-independent transporter DctM subunit
MIGPELGIWGIVAVLVGLLLLKVPPGFVMAMVGLVGMAVATSWSGAMHLLGSSFWRVFSSEGLVVVPMFILLGELIFYAGYSDLLYRTAHRWLGHLPGGLALATVAASAGFSAICGSNTATAATMSAVAIPSMEKYRYHPAVMTGSVAAGSTLGVMIPPSIVLVVYGLYTSQSIGKLFLGALVPALLLAGLMAGTILLQCLRHPQWGPRGERATWRERLRSIPAVLDVLVLFALIMLALGAGITTATEAAAFSSFLAIVICVIRRRLTWRKFAMAIRDTLRISCMVFLIVAGADVFGRFLNATQLPQQVAQTMGNLNWPAWLLLVALLGVYAIGGCLMDALAFLLVSLPIFLPLVEQMGYDLVWFGVLVCVVTTLGAITPPIGISCYVIAGMVKHIRVEQVFRGALVYTPSYAVTTAVMILLPEPTVMWLASLAK